MINQAVDNAPYDKTRVGTVLERNDDNTYTIKIDGVIYRKIAIMGGLRADIGDIVKVVIPTNNPSQMFISTVRYTTEIISIGEIKMYAGNDEPTGWLKCDGRAVSRTTYSALFNVIGTTYGTGDGSTTFNLPDMRDRFPVGAGSDYSLNDTGGEAEVTLTTDEMPAHTHGDKSLTGGFYNRRYGASGTGTDIVGINPSGITSKNVETWSGSHALINIDGRNQNNSLYDKIVVDASHEHDSVGDGQAHENRPPYIGLNFLIFAGRSA